MDWDNILFYGVISFVVSLAIGFLNKGSSQPVQANSDGTVELHLPKIYQILGYTLLALGIIFVMSFWYFQEVELLIFGLIICLFCCALGIPLLLYYKNHIVKLDDECLEVSNWLGKSNKIQWSEIAQISFHPFKGYIKVQGLERKLLLHQHLVGLKTFLLKMEQHTKWRISDLKIPMP
ncbi:MAG: hypothetical protein AAGI23_10650 [Bacteroidota bacterium]